MERDRQTDTEMRRRGEGKRKVGRVRKNKLEVVDHETEKAMAPHSSTLAWKSHGQRSLVGCSPWGR